MRYGEGHLERTYQLDKDFGRLSELRVMTGMCGGKGICYRYPMKVYNSTLPSAQVFHVRGTCEILLKFYHRRKFQTFRRGGGGGLE